MSYIEEARCLKVNHVTQSKLKIQHVFYYRKPKMSAVAGCLSLKHPLRFASHVTNRSRIIPVHVEWDQSTPNTCRIELEYFQYMSNRIRVPPIHVEQIQSTPNTCRIELEYSQYMTNRIRVLSRHVEQNQISQYMSNRIRVLQRHVEQNQRTLKTCRIELHYSQYMSNRIRVLPRHVEQNQSTPKSCRMRVLPRHIKYIFKVMSSEIFRHGDRW